MFRKVAITGASGFIGSHFVDFLSRKGVVVVPLSRKTGYSLEGHLNYEWLEGCDTVLHCAYVKATQSRQHAAINFMGTQNLYQAAKKAGVKNFVYISSMSAQENTGSEYGRAKLACESILNPNSDYIIRPGLVLGAGGFYQQICSVIRDHKIVPLLGGAHLPVQTIFIDDLILGIYNLVNKNQVGLHIAAEMPGPTIGLLLQEIANQLGLKRMFLSVPIAPVLIALKITHFLGLRTPIDYVNVQGLKHFKAQASDRFGQLSGVNVRNYKESLKAIT